MHATLEELLEKRPVILDGAWGTQLQERGLKPGESPEAWNLEAPEKVNSVAREYVEAGSDIILTNTFGGNKYVLESHGLSAEAAEICRRGAELSKSAAGDDALVFGSMGPSGKMVMMGEISAEEAESAFSEQAEALAAGGVDGIVIETMSDIEEVRNAVKAASRTGLPVVACMVYDSGPDGNNTMMGTTPEDAASALLEAGADVVGSNCGRGIETFAPICERLAKAADNPVWVKPNAGLPELVDGQNVYRMDAETFGRYAPELVSKGAGFVGGCCGSTPAFVAALVETLS